MNPSFTRFWARILVAVGLALAASGVFLAAVALVIDMPWGSITGHAVAEVTLVAFFLAVSGRPRRRPLHRPRPGRPRLSRHARPAGTDRRAPGTAGRARRRAAGLESCPLRDDASRSSRMI